MEKLTELWATVRQLLTSRTIWGVVVMLLGYAGLDVSGLDGALVDLGDKLIVAAGALLALIGYVDRRPKPGVIEVKAQK